ncbi:MAG: hypothetical protein IJT28_08155 [Bacteroidaceae bacterium]|nr:hypothetical protein [Bacteroidaceae bacterium]
MSGTNQIQPETSLNGGYIYQEEFDCLKMRLTKRILLSANGSLRVLWEEVLTNQWPQDIQYHVDERCGMNCIEDSSGC